MPAAETSVVLPSTAPAPCEVTSTRRPPGVDFSVLLVACPRESHTLCFMSRWPRCALDVFQYFTPASAPAQPSTPSQRCRGPCVRGQWHWRATPGTGRPFPNCPRAGSLVGLWPRLKQHWVCGFQVSSWSPVLCRCGPKHLLSRSVISLNFHWRHRTDCPGLACNAQGRLPKSLDSLVTAWLSEEKLRHPSVSNVGNVRTESKEVKSSKEPQFWKYQCVSSFHACENLNVKCSLTFPELSFLKILTPSNSLVLPLINYL